MHQPQFNDSAPRHLGPGAGRLITCWQKIPSLYVTEALLESGLDGVCLDMANGSLSIQTIAELLSYRSGAARATFVRTPETPAESLIGRLLDEGADGIIIPHLQDPEDARRYARAARFSPRGTRGMGSTGRAGRWGLASRDEYLAGSRRVPWAPLVTGMVEDAATLARLDELTETAELDAVMIGSADLMHSTGLSFSELSELLSTAAATVRSAGALPAIAVGTPEQARTAFELGFEWCVVSNDISILARASVRNIDEIAHGRANNTRKTTE